MTRITLWTGITVFLMLGGRTAHATGWTQITQTTGGGSPPSTIPAPTNSTANGGLYVASPLQNIALALADGTPSFAVNFNSSNELYIWALSVDNKDGFSCTDSGAGSQEIYFSGTTWHWASRNIACWKGISATGDQALMAWQGSAYSSPQYYQYSNADGWTELSGLGSGGDFDSAIVSDGTPIGISVTAACNTATPEGNCVESWGGSSWSDWEPYSNPIGGEFVTVDQMDTSSVWVLGPNTSGGKNCIWNNNTSPGTIYCPCSTTNHSLSMLAVKNSDVYGIDSNSDVYSIQWPESGMTCFGETSLSPPAGLGSVYSIATDNSTTLTGNHSLWAETSSGGGIWAYDN